MKMPSGAAALIFYLILWALLFGWQKYMPPRIGQTVPMILGVALPLFLGGVRARLRDYRPSSKLDARIANEKIKLTVQAINASAIAIVGFWVASKIFTENENPFSNPLTALYLAIAVWWHWTARQMLNFLKDEDAASFERH